MNQADAETLWYSPTMDVFLNRWFSNYNDARRSLDTEGGYLLPYKNHFFVCEAEAIRAMGLDPDDPDWRLINHDGARPSNEEAYRRLPEKRLRAINS